MNINILQKCLDELSKEDPRLDYIRGMLETVIELAGSSKVEQASYVRPVASSSPAQPTTEAELLDAAAAASLERIKKLAQESME